MTKVDDIVFERHQPGDITHYRAWQIQRLTNEAWRADLADERTTEEIDYRFGLGDAELHEAATIFRGFARHGNLIIASSRPDRLVGVAMTRNDVSPVRTPGLGPLATRMAKRVHGLVRPEHSHVHPWTMSVAVHPRYARRGIGSELIYQSHQQFDPRQVARAYVFDEGTPYAFDNEGNVVEPSPEPFSSVGNGSFEFLKACGYELVLANSPTEDSDEEKQPVRYERQSRPGYFGPGTRPVVQYSMQAKVETILDNTDSLVRADKSP